MARTVEEIKRKMTDLFVRDTTVRELYDLDAEKSFDEQFSKASIESILFYVMAFGIQTLERIFDTHKSEVNEIIDNILPHRPKWYRDKALNFMLDEPLITDTDRYNTENMTDEEINHKHVVKYATAIEQPGSSVLVIKIATGEPGNLQPLPGGTGSDATGQAGQFKAYIDEIRDAGVRWNLVNEDGDEFSVSLDIYYSPTLNEGRITENVKNAIRAYITGLPFNGEYSNMALIDAIQCVEGVMIAELNGAATSNGIAINAKTVPNAGYFTFEDNKIKINPIPHYAIQ